MNIETRSRLFLVNIGLVITLLAGCVAPAAPATTQTIAFTHVNLIPMTSERVIEDQTVLVKGSEIVVIGDSDTVKIPRGAQVIDGKDAYLMPGLADMHMHTMSNWDDRTVWPVNPLYLYLANGVTTIRDNGPFPGVSGDFSYVLQWRDEIRAGSRIGPTLYASGVRLGDGSPRGSGDPVELVRWNHEQGFDFLKIYSLLSIEDFQAAMKTAKELGMYTTGHIPWSVGLDSVLAEGMDEIAHAESAPAIALQPEAWLSRPELKFEMAGYVESFKRGESRYQVACRRNVEMKKYCENVKYEFDRWILSGLLEAGVQLLLGSDTAVGQGIVAGFSIHDDLRILVENGFTPYEALLTGTVNAARVVEKMTGEGNFGTIEVGNRADLILVRGNPLKDINIIREPLGVMAAGRWYSAEQLAKMIEIPGSQK